MGDRRSQCQKVFTHMKLFGSINPLEALEHYGVMRLASRISDLKDTGIAIKCTMTCGRNRDGEEVRFATYSLVGDDNEQ